MKTKKRLVVNLQVEFVVETPIASYFHGGGVLQKAAVYSGELSSPNLPWWFLCFCGNVVWIRQFFNKMRKGYF